MGEGLTGWMGVLSEVESIRSLLSCLDRFAVCLAVMVLWSSGQVALTAACACPWGIWTCRT